MRSELLPPAADGRLRNLLEEAYRRIEARDAPADVADWLTSVCGHEVSAEWLDGSFGSTDPVAAAWELRVSDQPHFLRRVQPTRDELVEIVERLSPESSEWDPDREAWWRELFEAHVPHPDAWGAYLLPAGQRGSESVGRRAIVAHALAYRPIAL